MPTITAIKETKRRAGHRRVYLDGAFAFSCHINVIARFGLREGRELTAERVAEIEQGEIRQQCFDKAMRQLETRLHSRAELRTKLKRHEFTEAIIDDVLNDLQRMGYVDDARFAETLAASAAEHKHHGRRRAYMELMKKGIDRTTADRALERVYETHDSLATARELALKRAPSLARFDRQTAHRRMAGMLLRRGYDYDTIRPILDEVLGYSE